MARINPFNPNSPTPSGAFVGRVSELKRLERDLIQTRAENPCSFLITGERGIGKTSLLSYFKYVAEGLIKIDGEKMNFLVVDTDLDQNTTQQGLLRKIELGLENKLAKSEKARSFLKEAWTFLQRIETSAIKLRAGDENHLDEVVLEQFSYNLADVVNRACNRDGGGVFDAGYDGMAILIDEADNAPSSLGLGSFFKLLTERLQKRGCNRVMIGLAGLPGVRDVLLESHPSSLRIFEELKLDPLTDDEVGFVIDGCLRIASSKNNTIYRITKDAKQYLIALSEGYPHFIQQFGSSAFDSDSDEVIDVDDAYKGAFAEHGALELIGDRYYRNDFYKKIQKNGYRQVLRIMAKSMDAWVSKQAIRQEFKGKDSVLDNAIKALRDRHIILSKEGEKGLYRLQQKGFAIWISLQTPQPDDPRMKPPARPGNTN